MTPLAQLKVNWKYLGTYSYYSIGLVVYQALRYTWVNPQRTSKAPLVPNLHGLTQSNGSGPRKEIVQIVGHDF